MQDFQQAQAVSSMTALMMTGFQSYLNALIENGAVEGRLGQQTLIQELEPAMEIIHKVLAGAQLEVHIHVIREPDADLVAEFEQRRQEAEKKANQLNKDLGGLYVMG